MHDAVRIMLERYACQSRDEYVQALREILQELALLGLWRGKFFEHAAAYGGTALRVLHGLDRFSEDLDFSLLQPNPEFRFDPYGNALRREIGSFGFTVRFEQKEKNRQSAVESAFLKADTYRELILIEASEDLLRGLHPEKILRIKLEVDTNPPGGFETESRYLLQPIPFAVRTYSLPDLLAGKLHAVLCRRWKNRVKGRDWYDLLWYAGRHPHVRLLHLEARMRQSGDYGDPGPLTPKRLLALLQEAIRHLDVPMARREVAPFVRDQRSLEAWSPDLFQHAVQRLEPLVS